MLELSLNEVEGLAQKAARGGGFAWGLADDAGRTARWLALHGADWAGGLLTLLDSPRPPDRCPIRGGALLADLAAKPGLLSLALIFEPAWLLPPLLAATRLHGHALSLRLGTVDIAATVQAVSASASWLEIFALRTAPVSARIGGTPVALPFALAASAARPTLPPALAARLHDYAARTYVPATEQSRSRGAGGTRLDDD